MTKTAQIASHGYVRSAGQQARQSPQAPDESFAEVMNQAAGEPGLKFSNHARKRLQTREIRLTGDGFNRLVEAVEKAEKRGGRESLVLMDDLAFIVNIRDRVVVTAMDARKRGEGVFTHIDSVVLANPPSKIDSEA